jgi:hypothetical protein
MGRPKGSKDNFKRKTRNQYGFSAKEANDIKKLKNEHKTNKEIQKITGLSKSQIKKICFENNIKHINPNFLSQKCEIEIDDRNKKLCGIYIISIYRKDGYQGHYVGSSIDINKRCLTHRTLLEKNKHYNTKMQEDFNNKISAKYRIWLIEHEHNLINLENEIIKNYVGLYNTWVTCDIDEMKDFLQVAAIKIENKYTIDKITNCWNCNNSRRDGYGRDLQVKIDGKNKHLKPHRISFYKYYGEYPALIRHKCNNRLCINPEHLEHGSYKENAIDTYKHKWQLFAEKWHEYDGNYVKLTEFFGYKKNYTAANGDKYYSGIITIAKKLGLVA